MGEWSRKLGFVIWVDDVKWPPYRDWKRWRFVVLKSLCDEFFLSWLATVFCSSSDKIAATLESLHHSVSLAGVVGTALFRMFLGASMVLPDQPLSPPHRLLQLHGLHPSGIAHSRLASAAGTTPKKMISTGIGSLVAHHPLARVPLQTTPQEAVKVG